MKHSFKRLSIIIVSFGISSFHACINSSDPTLGNNFFESDANMVYTDTFTVKLSTLILDSIETSGKEIALVGKYNDENIGILNSKSYLILGSETTTLDENAIYDSLIFIAYPTGYYYGDTLCNYKLVIHRVIETIEEEKYDGMLCNNSNFEFDPTPLGEKTFKPNPKGGNEIRIPIINSLGIDLINKFKSSSNPFSEDGGFVNYFKGIQLETDDATNSIIGYYVNDTSLILRLYYHIDGYDENDYIDLNPSNTQLQFNQISADSTNSVVSKLSQKTIDSELLNNNAYVQGGTGIVARIDLPSLKNMLIQNRKFEIIKAELTIQPSMEMDSKYLPSNLNLYVTNKHNDFITQITDEDGNVVNGSLYQDYEYRENTYYTWDITSYIKILVENPNSEYNGLLLLPENYDKEFNHVIIANQSKSKYHTKLKLLIFYYE